MSTTQPTFVWPERPYKGLTQYTYDDAPLFAGRDAEILSCAKGLLRSDISFFLLHGDTGCGKSSFLQAGLLPFLDGLRARTNSNQPNAHSGSTLLPVALAGGRVVRSGRKPLSTLARATYNLISGLKSSGVDFPDSLEKGLLGCRSRRAFIDKVGASEWSLFEALGNVSLSSARDKYLLVVDQAEDIFASGSDAEHIDTKRYFSLLSLFSSEAINMKMLISLRSEFREKFDRALEENRVDFAKLSRYHLESIGPEGIVRAILHPTQLEPRIVLNQNLGSPFERYHFRYADGLPEMIRDDLTPLSGRTLPILQVICDRLHSHWRDQAKKDASKTHITEADYRVTGAASAQIGSHLEEKIVSFFQRKIQRKISRRKTNYADKADRWRTVLYRLVDIEDGTRAKVAVPQTDIVDWAKEAECEDSLEMIDWLSSSECYILQPAYSTPTSSKCWRLLHDTLALSLSEWQSNKRAGQRCSEQMGNKSILGSEPWSWKDLYAVQPPTVQFQTINDLIWDHQIPLYAQAKGFTARVGLEFRVDRRFDLSQPEVNEIRYASFLKSSSPKRNRLVVLPGKLFKQITAKPWTTLGIPNLYRGFAIIGRKRKGLEPIKIGDRVSQKESERRLRKLAQVLARRDTKTFAFEEASKQFVGDILGWAGRPVRADGVKVRAPITNRYNTALDPMFTALVGEECQFALGTAPSRALAEQAGFAVFADFTDVEHILKGKHQEKLNALKLHETWAVDIAPHQTAVLMRLASVMLYSVEYVRANPDDFVRFLYNDVVIATADGAHLLQREFIRNAVTSCYSYVPLEQYFFEYLSPISTSRYAYCGADGPAHVFGELMQYRAKCDSILAKIGTCSHARGSVRKAIERATRHYQILNYYDAHRFLQQAARELGAA